jgi:hypothetical protein
MNIVRKITNKVVFGAIDIEKVIAAPDKKIDMIKVWGIASKARPDQGDMGAFIRFGGLFRALNLQTGEEFQAGAMILPGVAQDLLAGALGAGAESVTFGFKIGVHFDNTAVTKYVYDVESLFPPAEDDPLERLSQTVKSPVAIAAPVAETEKATAKAK